jgi:two-component system, OmpR family, sensor kinase
MRIRRWQANADSQLGTRASPKLGLTTRLLLAHAVLLTVTIGLILLLSYVALSRHQIAEAQADLAEELPEYQQAASHRPADEALLAFSAQYLSSHPPPPGRVLIIGLGGREAGAAPSTSALASAPLVRAWVASPPGGSTITDVSTPGTTYHVVAGPILSGGHAVGVLVAGVDLGVVQSQVVAILPVIAGEAGSALVIALVAGYLLLRRVRRTLAHVTETAATINRDDLSRRLDYRGPDDELGRLAQTFDMMLERVETAFISQRHLISDVSHQLRTPLTVMRGHLDVLRRGGINDPGEAADTLSLVINEIDHTNALVNQLLLLGQSSEPGFIDYERVDLRSFLADVFTSAQALAPRHWVLEPVPDAVVNIDLAKVRGALLNLIDNAVRATDPGDSIMLRASCDGELVLAVADTGIGISMENQKTVFQRFVYAGKNHGAGLGLTIVRAIAEAHGGHADLHSEAGAGCTVRMVLPASCIDSISPPHMDGVAP